MSIVEYMYMFFGTVFFSWADRSAWTKMSNACFSDNPLEFLYCSSRLHDIHNAKQFHYNVFILSLCRINGCYEVLEGGNTADALADFTGGVAEPVDLVDGQYATDVDKRMILYKELSDAMRNNHALVSASIRVRMNYFSK